MSHNIFVEPVLAGLAQHGLKTRVIQLIKNVD